MKVPHDETSRTRVSARCRTDGTVSEVNFTFSLRTLCPCGHNSNSLFGMATMRWRLVREFPDQHRASPQPDEPLQTMTTC